MSIRSLLLAGSPSAALTTTTGRPPWDATAASFDPGLTAHGDGPEPPELAPSPPGVIH